MGRHDKHGAGESPVAARTSFSSSANLGSSTSRKRARAEPASYSDHEDDQALYDSDSLGVEPQKKKGKSDYGEKRLRRFVPVSLCQGHVWHKNFP